MNEKIKEIVYKFAGLAKIDDVDLCNNLIEQLSNMSTDKSIDVLLISLNSLFNRNMLSQDDIFSNIDLLLSLSPEKYKNADDLIKRLHWIKSMNMDNAQIPLDENHKLILETFDKFNNLIGINFDCFYVGGLMGYLATNHSLERYHSDLDLLINEQQLEKLYELVSSSKNFEFVSNMQHKEVHGHEYQINYKGTPMSIGIFLFERNIAQEIVMKEYYYDNDNKNKDNRLFVDEHHLSKDYANIIFSTPIRKHNGTPYRVVSLEYIYNQKKNARFKDQYDASIIKDSIDVNIDSELDIQEQNNYDIYHKPATNSIIERMEKKINKPLEDESNTL